MEPIRASTLRIVAQVKAEQDITATCPRISPAMQCEMRQRDPQAYVQGRRDASLKREN